MKKYIRYFVVGAALALVAGAVPPRLYASQFGNEVVVDGVYGDNQNPAIAASSDGRRVFAAWDGLDENGNRRILQRESIDGEWLPAVRVDAEPSAENSAPSVSVDEQGNPHVAWLGRVGGKFNVFYAFRCMGRWTQYGAIAKPDSPDDTCDAATVRVDESGRPWIAWQQGSGSRYAIHCARLDEGTGAFREEVLSPAPKSYNLLPEVFFEPEPFVAWYSDDNSEFKVTGAKFDRTTGAWAPAAIANLAQLPSNRLPFLMRNASGALAALWNDGVESKDRAFLGFQDEASQGRGEVIDNRPESGTYALSGTASGNEIVAVWCSEAKESGPQVFAAHGSSLPFAQEELVSDSAKSYYSGPRACPLPDGAAIVWNSNAADGGDGRILFRRMKF